MLLFLNLCDVQIGPVAFKVITQNKKFNKSQTFLYIFSKGKNFVIKIQHLLNQVKCKCCCAQQPAIAAQVVDCGWFVSLILSHSRQLSQIKLIKLNNMHVNVFPSHLLSRAPLRPLLSTSKISSWTLLPHRSMRFTGEKGAGRDNNVVQ